MRFATTALSIGIVYIALAAQGDRIITESDRALTFGGRPSLTLPRGAPMLSDPVDLKVASFNEISVSVYLREKTTENKSGMSKAYYGETIPTTKGGAR